MSVTTKFWEKRRAWLEKNKIIFETFLFAAFTLMSLAIAGGSLWVATRQTDLVNRQTDILSLQQRPVLTFHQQLADPFKQPLGLDRLTINNAGGPVTNVSARLALAFNVIIGPPGQRRDVLVPVDGYSVTPYPTGNATGQIESLSYDATQSNYYTAALQMSRYLFTGPNHPGSCVQPDWYVLLTYTDAQGDNHQDPYYIGLYQYQKLPVSEISRVFSTAHVVGLYQLASDPVSLYNPASAIAHAHDYKPAAISCVAVT